MANLTTLGIGGKAKFFLKVENISDIKDALLYAKDKGLAFFVLGRGSNVLFLDDGYDGLVIKNECKKVSFEKNGVIAESGIGMCELVKNIHEKGLTGPELMVNIPGTLGGCIRGNAGGRGFEIGDIVTWVEVAELQNEKVVTRRINKVDCFFSYRNSLFKEKPGWVILRAELVLQRGDVKETQKIIHNDWKWRHEKQPYDYRSAGSIFKNPERGMSAGELIEKAGYKGYRAGDAEVSQKHANFIVNHGKATRKDVLNIINVVRSGVKEKFEVSLEPEIVIV